MNLDRGQVSVLPSRVKDSPANPLEEEKGGRRKRGKRGKGPRGESEETLTYFQQALQLL